ncbi:unnamed protein product [Gordionus sp. m RMFG-2023]
MVFYNLYVFNRNRECVFYREWHRNRQCAMSRSQEFKLTYGLVHSCKNFLGKIMNPALKFEQSSSKLIKVPVSNSPLDDQIHSASNLLSFSNLNKAKNLINDENIEFNIQISKDTPISPQTIINQAMNEYYGNSIDIIKVEIQDLNLAYQNLNPTLREKCKENKEGALLPTNEYHYFVIQCDKYKSHVFETANSSMKIVLNSSINFFDETTPSGNISALTDTIINTNKSVNHSFSSADVKALIEQIFGLLYVPYYVDNPLYQNSLFARHSTDKCHLSEKVCSNGATTFDALDCPTLILNIDALVDNFNRHGVASIT